MQWTGSTATAVARENGLSPTLVARWMREYKQNPEKAFHGPGHPNKDQAKIAELERTVGQLYAENLFLKKQSRDSRRRQRRRRPNLSTREVQNDT